MIPLHCGFSVTQVNPHDNTRKGPTADASTFAALVKQWLNRSLLVPTPCSSSPALTAALVTSAAAFKVPECLPDGPYIAFIDTDGTEVHQPFSGELHAHLKALDPNPSTPAAVHTNGTSPATKRSKFWETWCGCGFNMDHGNTDRAVQGVKDQCRASGQAASGYSTCSLRSNEVLYTVAGDIVAFLCYGGMTYDGRITDAFAKITEKCGWYIAGSALWEEELWLEIVHGYMRYTPGLDFCTNSISSGATHC
ncbi:hypothetical protein B0T22DRAFT_532615 [Podospora appendiculata]|uniref:Uncharacterized protein n=1 Tax=Podospora appendiculata TaxID=314037 RepID=A0AAE0XH59_9PEZI|nr:hypothetical protein B0T22DRAFT_532615 [Podospora appendiculata]